MDLYSYYAVIGLGSPSPQLRAASLSILHSLSVAAPGVVLGLLPRLLELRDDTWWEVRAAAAALPCWRRHTRASAWCVSHARSVRAGALHVGRRRVLPAG